MSRLSIPTREAAPAAAQPLLDAVAAQLGTVPNLFRLIGKSPEALEGFLGLHGALGRTLDLKTRNAIALAVAEANACDYCLSAHTFLARNGAKLDEQEIARNRHGRSGQAKVDAAVAFAAKVARNRGRVADSDFAAVRLAGWSEAQVVEILAHVALNVFTNYLNNAVQTDIDFPIVRAEAA